MSSRLRLVAMCVLSAFFVVQGFAQSADSPVNHQNVSNILGAGARALGMGGAFTAIADDATAATWNPAGLRILSKAEASVVYDSSRARQQWQYDAFAYSSDKTNSSYNRSQSVSDIASSRNSGINFASLTMPFELKTRRIVGQASYRRLISFPYTNNPYTYRDTSYNQDSGQTTSSLSNSLSYSGDAGGIDDYTVSLASKLAGNLDVGVSVNYMKADVNSRGYFTDLDTGNFRDDVRLAYSFKGLHYDLGLLYRWREMFSVGAVYHSGMSSDFHYTQRETLFYQPLGPSPELVNPGSSRIKLPTSYAAGVAVRPIGTLTLAADYSATAWSKARISNFNYQYIGFNQDFAGFQVTEIPYENGGFPYIGGTQEDTSTTRFGGEYMLVFPHSVTVPLRAGYFTEQQIINISGSGRPTYKGFTLGTGVGFHRVQLDLAWVRTKGVDQGVTGIEVFNSGTYNTMKNNVDFSSDRVLLSMIYRFQ